MRVLRYSFLEAGISLWRTRASALLSVATIASTLLVFGAFLLVTSNLSELVRTWSSAAEMSVYLRDDASEADRTAIERVLVESSIVQAREYVSKTEALERFKREFDDLSNVASTFPENPFPASFEIRISSVAARGPALDETVARLRQTQGVADVRFDRAWIDRLSAAVTVMRGLAVGFAAILIIGAALTVSNVVRLAVHARRQEIHIMRLVGAPVSFISGPFLAEGVVQGAAGAALALLCLWLGYAVASDQYGSMTTEILGLTRFQFLSPQLSFLIVLGGMFVGCLGGVLATWGALGPPKRPARAPADAI